MARPAAKKPVRTEFRDPVYALMEFTNQVPAHQQMMDYLMARRAVPEVQLRYLGDELHGVFEDPGVSAVSRTPAGPNGRISVANHLAADTLVHETAHAVNRQMSLQYGEEKSDPKTWPARGRTPFTDAYEKLIYSPYNLAGDPAETPVQQMMKLLAPAWTAAGKDYRTTTEEARAFAIGNSAVPELSSQKDSQAPPHVDATLATEFLILLDLAQRSQAKKPQSQGR